VKIYYDENMPYAQEFFKDFGQLQSFTGRDLCSESVEDADVLLVRSITQVNKELLENNNSLTFVGTATIGVEHIDQDYLKSRDVNFSSAPGCNAVSVAEYVLSALVVLAERYLLDLTSMTVGIVGAGNTGSRLSEKLTALGIKYLLCDPLLAKQGDARQFSSLEEILACDVISLHVPLTVEGEYPTYHMIDEAKLAELSSKQILINACRGEVVDNQVLLKLKQQGAAFKLVLDVWENEPRILEQLIDYCEIATAHIAGYSLEGKARGTEMLYQALCQHINREPDKSLEEFLPKAPVEQIHISQKFTQILLNQLVKLSYDVRRDDSLFRQQINTQGFDYIRKTYPARREFSSIVVSLAETAKTEIWHQLGFSQL
jgi:erythronate-4-phosphate dehydrogenase